MRMLLRATMDTQKSNDAVRNGQVPDLVKAMMDQLKPEAAYFTADRGRRSFLFVFDMTDSSQLPPICEPLFQQLGADITVQPCMNVEDLQRGLNAVGSSR